MQDILKRFFMYDQSSARWVLNLLSDEKAKRDSTFDHADITACAGWPYFFIFFVCVKIQL